MCLFHFSIGSASGRLVHHAPDRLVTIYHNITPARFFLGFHHHLMGLCYHGRRELEAFAPRSELGLGDSEYNRRELEAAGFARSGVLPIVLDVSKYSRRSSPGVERLYGDGRTNLLFVGRIIPNKKVDDLIRVFAVYKRWLDRSSRLLLVGDTRGHERYYDRLREMVRELRLDDVVFTGHVDDDDLIAYYRVSHLFLCLSEHEGFCVPLQEAMHFGLPVVAYDAGAVRETLHGGGVLLAEKRPEVVAELVRRILTDSTLRERILSDPGPSHRRGPPHRFRRAASGPPRARARRASSSACSRSRGLMRIDQWVPALHRGDAIGDSARLMRDAFRAWGHQADVYALDLDADLEGDGRRFSAWRPGGPEDVVILHFALPSPMTAALREHEGRRVLLHHNITPPEFFAPWDEELARICVVGPAGAREPRGPRGPRPRRQRVQPEGPRGPGVSRAPGCCRSTSTSGATGKPRTR